MGLNRKGDGGVVYIHIGKVMCIYVYIDELIELKVTEKEKREGLPLIALK